ncbi:hypothetical protein FA13DRAFT_1789416 [Coprinellus micaceus]|uniref:F-box domain-containing protein n=1 Tax=Coprinellus micaceus TaxID=71717 RepID=A0A4Y7TJC2_COPMI|nr:hypothetical protein FA13DRAFT_1789416 [Coprinellus micaceus]
MAPIDEIPDDILEEIFSPALLRRVCKEWRDLEFHLISHSPVVGLSTALPTSSQERLTKLSFGGDFARLESLSDLKGGSGFPALEELIVTAGTDSEVAHREVWRRGGPMSVFKNSALLRRVVLGSVSSDDYFPTIILPWQQLTHLIMLSPAPAGFYDAYMKEYPWSCFALLPLHTDSPNRKVAIGRAFQLSNSAFGRRVIW